MTQVGAKEGALQADPSKVFCKDASLVDIFGADVQPGRALVDEIIRVYKASFQHMSCIAQVIQFRLYGLVLQQVPSLRNVPFFGSGNDQQRKICRHPLNNRRQDTVLAEYVRSVQTRGIIRGVRGEAWLCAPNSDEGETVFTALTFGTLLLGSNTVDVCYASKVPNT